MIEIKGGEGAVIGGVGSDTCQHNPPMKAVKHECRESGLSFGSNEGVSSTSKQDHLWEGWDGRS